MIWRGGKKQSRRADYLGNLSPGCLKCSDFCFCQSCTEIQESLKKASEFNLKHSEAPVVGVWCTVYYSRIVLILKQNYSTSNHISVRCFSSWWSSFFQSNLEEQRHLIHKSVSKYKSDCFHLFIHAANWKLEPWKCISVRWFRLVCFRPVCYWSHTG